MSARTPGEWRYVRGSIYAGDHRIAVLDAHGETLAEHDANARLLGAAADLLAVVRQVFDLTEAATYTGCLRAGVPERAEAERRRDEILEQARAALAKATGEVAS